MDSPTLVSHITEVGLLPEDEATRARIAELSRRLPVARDLARELIQLNVLTPYQANQLLTGRAQTLVLGPYQILERLGEGGMGQVFKGRHRRLHRVVALKVVRPERVGNAIAVQRFRREIELVARLDHPNIVRAFDADEVDGTIYFAMECAAGIDLARLVKERGPLPVAQACDYTRQAALGLQHIYENGLAHRDVKPNNLMLTARPDGAAGPGVVKILDLGQARLCEEPEPGPRQLALTHLGTVLGTADYMSPEQALDSRQADIRSDLYSLGCTLYYLLTGKPPYPGGTAIEKLMRHQLEESEPVERLRPDVPPGLVAVLRRMMARKPAERYQLPAEVALALEPFARPDLPITIVPQAVHADAVAPRRRQALRPWRWVAAVAAVVGTVLAAVFVFRLVHG